MSEGNRLGPRTPRRAAHRDRAARPGGAEPGDPRRRFQRELGTTPLVWPTAERVDLARSLIERGETRLDVVARRSGLGSPSNLRARLRRRTGLTPTAHRQRFGPAA